MEAHFYGPARGGPAGLAQRGPEMKKPRGSPFACYPRLTLTAIHTHVRRTASLRLLLVGHTDGARVPVLARGYRGGAYQRARSVVLTAEPGRGSGGCHLDGTLILILTPRKARLAGRRRRENADGRPAFSRFRTSRADFCRKRAEHAARETARGIFLLLSF